MVVKMFSPIRSSECSKHGMAISILNIESYAYEEGRRGKEREVRVKVSNGIKKMAGGLNAEDYQDRQTAHMHSTR